MDDTLLSDVFNNDINDIEDTQEEVAEPKEDSQKENKEPDEEVQTKSEGEDQEKSEPPALTDDKPNEEVKPEESWTKKAVIDERRKRQELERKVRDLEARFSQPNQEQYEDSIPDPVDDPVGYKNYVKNSLKQELFVERVNESKIEMQAEHEDFLEMEDKFMELSAGNPNLNQELLKAKNPAKFAYDTAKNYFDTQKLNDPSYKANLREELKKEILAELVKTQNSASKDSLGVNLPNLTNRSSIDTNVTQQLKETSSLVDIFGDTEF